MGPIIIGVDTHKTNHIAVAFNIQGAGLGATRGQSIHATASSVKSAVARMLERA